MKQSIDTSNDLTNQTKGSTLFSVTPEQAVDSLIRCYPKIYLACHRQHVRDEKTKRLLSAQQASILDHLDAVEPTGVQQLASHMGVTASTMSLNLDRLEGAGYLARTRDQEDSRRVQIRLTKAGVRIKQQQKVLDPDLVRNMLQQLSPHELEKAIVGLELLGRAAGAVLSQTWSRK
jgi:MarR family transcriptional regulator, organic hydroperoxide resistance regulator